MTVTLEDIGYILGLLVFGEGLTCGEIPSPRAFFMGNWFEPLTVTQTDDALYMNHVNFTWLFETYGKNKS